MTVPVEPRKTFFGGVALPIFSWGLPFHSLVIAILFGAIGFSAGGVRALAAWKEIAVAALLIVVVVRAAMGHGPRVAVSWVDLAVGAVLLIAFGFFVAGRSLLRIDLPPIAELYGLRDIAFFLLLYYVGRASPEIVDDPDTLRRIYIIAVLTSSIAIIEWFFVTPSMLVVIGITAYFQDFLSVSAFTAGNDFGLPMNYWTRIGNVEVQRAGSIYLSSQGFAIPFLLILPAATAWFVRMSKPRALSARIEYSIIWIGLLLTITRMTIFVCVVQLLLMILMFRKPMWAVAGAITGVSLVVVALFALPGFANFVWSTLSWQTGSSASHLNDWGKGIQAFLQSPFGSGLGTTDQSAVRTGLDPLTADNGYLKYAVELGVEGLIAYLLVFVGIGIAALRVARFGVTSQSRLFGAVVFCTTVGVTINAATAVVFNALTLSYLYFWFAGAIVSVSQQQVRPRSRHV